MLPEWAVTTVVVVPVLDPFLRRRLAMARWVLAVHMTWEGGRPRYWFSSTHGGTGGRGQIGVGRGRTRVGGRRTRQGRSRHRGDGNAVGMEQRSLSLDFVRVEIAQGRQRASGLTVSMLLHGAPVIVDTAPARSSSGLALDSVVRP